ILVSGDDPQIQALLEVDWTGVPHRSEEQRRLLGLTRRCWIEANWAACGVPTPPGISDTLDQAVTVPALRLCRSRPDSHRGPAGADAFSSPKNSRRAFFASTRSSMSGPSPET